MNFEHIRTLVYDQPWSITLDKLAAIQQLLAMRLSGQKLEAEDIRDRIGAVDARRNTVRNGAIAVMPIYGVLLQRLDMLLEMSGGTSTDRLAKDFRALMGDPNIGTIVLDVDSPGGGVYGIGELAAEIFAARSEKRIVAVVNSMAGSAAYWLATAAQEVVVTTGGEVGSIGCYMIHEDWSGAYEMAGVKPTLIKFGEHKAEGNDIEPLSEEARDYIQKRVDGYGMDFVRDVAKNRGVDPARVMKDWGQGRMFRAREAVRLGMADRVGTLQETLLRLSGRTMTAGARAMAPGHDTGTNLRGLLEAIELEEGQAGTVTGDGSGEALPPFDGDAYDPAARVLAPERAAAQRDLALARFRE